MELNYDVVVAGGGIGGVCAAIASARHGAHTALIQDRPVLGGNAGSEIRMHICGASCHGKKKDARETGILEEILLENKYRNPNHSFSVFDTVLWEKTHFQQNLDLYLNTYIDRTMASGGEIRSLHAIQTTTEKEYTFACRIVIDCTGDGVVSLKAGADIMTGREGKDVFGEANAVEKSDQVTMGSSILFEAEDVGHPVTYMRPEWAYHYEEKDLMGHKEITSGYWWVEIGGTRLHTIKDSETIRDELLRIVYGIWDHIKNGGTHGAENYALKWIGFLPGKRESRRIRGAYVLKEQDVLGEVRFADAVAYGGWHIDAHMPEKFAAIGKNMEQTEDKAMDVPGFYTIPYRCLYSANIRNLMMGGRLISASHRAFSSTRVMGTCAVVSQAAGCAAALSVKKHIYPSALSEDIRELQQALLRDDCYIPGCKLEDTEDLILRSRIQTSDETDDGKGDNVRNGINRRTESGENAWIAPLCESKGCRISFVWGEMHEVREVDLTFDSNLSDEIMPSLSDWMKSREKAGMPSSLVKEYTIDFYNDNHCVQTIHIIDNYQRYRVHKLQKVIFCDCIKVTVISTYGDDKARVFAVRVYGETGGEHGACI